MSFHILFLLFHFSHRILLQVLRVTPPALELHCSSSHLFRAFISSSGYYYFRPSACAAVLTGCYKIPTLPSLQDIIFFILHTYIFHLAWLLGLTISLHISNLILIACFTSSRPTFIFHSFLSLLSFHTHTFIIALLSLHIIIYYFSFRFYYIDYYALELLHIFSLATFRHYIYISLALVTASHLPRPSKLFISAATTGCLPFILLSGLHIFSILLLNYYL